MKVIDLPLEQYEEKLMEVFDCDNTWPICLYDFTFKNKTPNFLCYKSQEDLTSCVIDDFISNPTTNYLEPSYIPRGKNDKRNISGML